MGSEGVHIGYKTLFDDEKLLLFSPEKQTALKQRIQEKIDVIERVPIAKPTDVTLTTLCNRLIADLAKEGIPVKQTRILTLLRDRYGGNLTKIVATEHYGQKRKQGYLEVAFHISAKEAKSCYDEYLAYYRKKRQEP